MQGGFGDVPPAAVRIEAPRRMAFRISWIDARFKPHGFIGEEGFPTQKQRQ